LAVETDAMALRVLALRGLDGADLGAVVVLCIFFVMSSPA
jgi:hypothetical protein